MSRENIGANLRRLRGTRRREEVATAVNISVSALTMYELGRRVPRDETKIALANFYGVPIADIFFGGNIAK